MTSHISALSGFSISQRHFAKSMRGALRTLAVVSLVGSGLALTQSALAATKQIGANEHYFNGASWNTMTSTGPCENSQSGTGSGAIDGVAFSFNYSGETSNMGGVCTTYPPALHIPAGNDEVATVPMLSMKRGVAEFTATGAFPAGSVLMLDDVDAGEHVKVTFYSACPAPFTVMDARSFDLVKISDASEPGWPTMTAPASPADPWSFDAAALNNDSLTSGIVLPAGVCGFKIDATGTDAEVGGSFGVFLVKPKQPAQPPLSTPASVPALDAVGLSLLGLLSAGLGGLALRRRQRS